MNGGFHEYKFKKLFNAFSALVASTRNALVETSQTVHDTAYLLHQKSKKKLKYGHALIDTVENKKETEAKEQQEDDYEQYDTIPKTTLVYVGINIKEFRGTANSNVATNTRMIRGNLTPHVEMRTKVIYSFKSEIQRSAG